MTLTKLGMMAAAVLGLGLSAMPASAQRHHPGDGRPGAHRPDHRPHARSYHRKKRVCQTVRRHGHRERRCHYR